VRNQLPPGTRIVADNFKVGAQLGFALGDAAVPVVEHPLNRAHGRAPQLRLWGLELAQRSDLGTMPLLLVASPSDIKLSELLGRYQELCRRFGPLPPPRITEADRGGKRFLLFVMDARDPASTPETAAPCVSPAIAHVNRPLPGASVPRRFAVDGWAIKDIAGVARVEVTLDGRVVAAAEYGLRDDLPQAFYAGLAKDPGLPDVGFRAQVDATAMPPGRYWLGLRITGGDGSRENFTVHALELRDE
jgi:hypothetical protein